MGKVFKILFNTLLVIIILALGAYFTLRLTGKIEIYNVKTGSMEDKIHAGDYILIHRKGNYQIGDVVTFQRDNGFITHRIIKKEGSKIITKGDANNTEDESIDESIIVGKVILSGGVLNTVINYKYVIVCVLLSFYLFSCYFEKGENVEYQKDEDKKEEEIASVTEEIEEKTENEETKEEISIEKETVEENTEEKEKIMEIGVEESEKKEEIESTPIETVKETTEKVEEKQEEKKVEVKEKRTRNRKKNTETEDKKEDIPTETVEIEVKKEKRTRSKKTNIETEKVAVKRKPRKKK